MGTRARGNPANAGEDRAPYRQLPIVVVDDDREFLDSLSAMLRAMGSGPVHEISDSRDLLPFLERMEPSVIVLDLVMPHLSGSELIPVLHEKYPQVPVIVVTGSGDLNVAVECMKAGAFHYLVKPPEPNKFCSIVRKALELRELRDEIMSLHRQLLSVPAGGAADVCGIVTRNPTMVRILRYVEAVAPSLQPVLITGETGVGKELIARAIHERSRREGMFVSVNAAGLDDMLFTDTLFGHCRGAYTGAHEAREGLLARARGGTIFLDEIGDLEMRSQIKLLRLLEEKEYRPLGADEARRTDARFVCATQWRLGDLVASATFRNDLYFRLRAHHVHVPPLRERMEDLPFLLDACLTEAVKSMGKKKPNCPPELIKLLSSYHFPGNVRELRAMIFDAVAQHESGVLSLESFRGTIEGGRSVQPTSAVPARSEDADPPFELLARFPTLADAEEYLFSEALKRAGGNQGIAGQLLGISREAVNRRLRRGKEREAEIRKAAS